MDCAFVVSSPTLSLQDATKELGFCTPFLCEMVYSDTTCLVQFFKCIMLLMCEIVNCDCVRVVRQELC